MNYEKILFGSSIKIPPSSEIIEDQVIASFISDRNIFVNYCGLILPEYFYFDKKRTIFNYMISENCNDPIILMEKFPNEVGFIASCLETIASTSNLCAHIDILKDLYFRRILITASEICQNEAFEQQSDITVNDIVEKFQSKISEIQNHVQSRPYRIGEILPQVFKEIEAAQKHEFGEILTGLKDLDETFGGFRESELVIIAGRSSMGKSAFALHLSIHNSVTRKIPVLIYSLEMSKILTSSRILFSSAKVDYDAAQRGYLPQREYPKLSIAAGPLNESEIYINDSSEITIGQISLQAEWFKRQWGIGYIIIDHLQIINHIDHAMSKHQQLSEITRQLHGVAKRLGVPIILLSQLNRMVENRKPPRPQLSDLRESGSIEENSDKVIFLYRPDYYDENDSPGVVEIIYGKNRNGRTGYKRIHFDKTTMTFKNLERSSEARMDF